MPEIRSVRMEEYGELTRMLEVTYNHKKGFFQKYFPNRWRKENFEPENKLIIKEDGKITSHIGIFPMEIIVGKSRIKSGGIGAVGTHPDYRQKGYMGKMLESAIKKMKDEGYVLSPLWGDATRYGNYGWTTAVRYLSFVITRNSLRFRDKKRIKIEKYEKNSGRPRLLEKIISAHEREYMRIGRTARDYKLIMDKAGKEAWLANILGEDFGYVSFRGNDKTKWVIEHGGNAETVLSLCLQIIEERNLDDVRLLCPYRYGRGMTTFYNGAGSYEVLPNTVLRVIDLRKTLDAFKAQMEERIKSLDKKCRARFCLQIEKEKERVGIDVGDGIDISDKEYKEKIILSRMDMTRVLFGLASPHVLLNTGKLSGLINTIFPLDFYIWGLDSV